MTLTHYSRFVTACKKRGIHVKLTEKKYDEMRLEIVPHLVKVNVVWKTEVGDLIDWLYDHGFRTVDANRLRNRMRNAHKYAQQKFKKQEEAEKESACMRGSRTAYVPSPYVEKLTKLV